MEKKFVEIGLEEEKVMDNHVIYFPTKLDKNQLYEYKLTLESHYVDASLKIMLFLNDNEMEQLVQQSNLVI